MHVIKLFLVNIGLKISKNYWILLLINNLSIAKDTKEITERINVEKSTKLVKDNEIYKDNKIQENTTTENNIKISKLDEKPNIAFKEPSGILAGEDGENNPNESKKNGFYSFFNNTIRQKMSSSVHGVESRSLKL